MFLTCEDKIALWLKFLSCCVVLAHQTANELKKRAVLRCPRAERVFDIFDQFIGINLTTPV
ncbi:hypothetical protein COO92_21190 [Thalassospira lohafexi]|uniref:Uncharacterized protein n=1 Tax=Thalassospira lohafexi TaxID=744227 RepID=A0A2N3L117_9PROT|nr:hypothetical protein COO92_21190 [Thalassospira lohafexi]